jgi:hypothetical protein
MARPNQLPETSGLDQQRTEDGYAKIDPATRDAVLEALAEHVARGSPVYKTFEECLDTYTAGGGEDAEQESVEGEMTAGDPDPHLRASAGDRRRAMDSALRLRMAYDSGRLSEADYVRILAERRRPQITPAQRKIAVSFDSMFPSGRPHRRVVF